LALNVLYLFLNATAFSPFHLDNNYEFLFNN
jgi:hypothetical protein